MANEMGILEQVVDFFQRLVRGRIDGANITANAKLRNIEAQAKSAVAKTFNQAVDGTLDKGKQKAQGLGKKKGDDSKA